MRDISRKSKQKKVEPPKPKKKKTPAPKPAPKETLVDFPHPLIPPPEVIKAAAAVVPEKEPEKKPEKKPEKEELLGYVEKMGPKEWEAAIGLEEEDEFRFEAEEKFPRMKDAVDWINKKARKEGVKITEIVKL